MYKQLQFWVKGETNRQKLLILVILALILFLISLTLYNRGNYLLLTAFFFLAGIFTLLTTGLFAYSVRRITDSDEASEELRKQKKLLNATLESLQEGLIISDRQARIVYLNTRAEEITGWETAEAKNLPLEDVYNVVNEQTGKSFQHIVSRILREGRSIDLENNTILRTRYGQELVICSSGSPVFDEQGEISHVVLAFHDITEKKKTEKKLLEREKQYVALIQHLPEAVYTCDEYGYIQLYNKAAEKLWGRKPVNGSDQWAGAEKLFDTQGSEIAPGVCPMATAIKEKRPVYGEQVIIRRPDGSLRHVLPYPTPLFDEQGNVCGAVNMLIDVTEKKEKEILVRQTEEKFRSLIEQASDAVLLYSFDGTIHEFNPAAYQMTGYSPEEFRTLQLNDLLVGEVVINEENVRRMRAGESVIFRRQIRTKGGGILEAEVSARLLPDGRSLAVVRNITERLRAEEELKLEREMKQQEITRAVLLAQENERQDIGRELHDNINQILASSRLYLTMAREKEEARLKLIHEADELISTAIHEIRLLSHALIAPSLHKKNLEKSLDELATRMEKAAGIRVVKDYAGFPCELIDEKICVTIYRVVQEQFNNILKYAKASEIRLRLSLKQHSILLSISDNGIGFDPTVKTGGVGLLNIHTRVSLLKGEVEVNTAPGMGCDLRVQLPFEGMEEFSVN